MRLRLMRDALAPPPAKRAAKKSSTDELRTVTLVCRFVNEQGDALASSAPIVVDWNGTVASSTPSPSAPAAVPLSPHDSGGRGETACHGERKGWARSGLASARELALEVRV